MRHKPSGFMLITSFLLIASLVTLLLVSLTRSTMEVSAARRFVARQQAFHLAEAALDQVFANLRAGKGPSVALTPQSPGEFWAEVPPSTSGQYQVTAVGQVGSITRSLQAVVQFGQLATFNYPIVADYQVAIGVWGSVTTDSYDSRLGVYRSIVAGYLGDVVSNVNPTTAGGLQNQCDLAVKGHMVIANLSISNPKSAITLYPVPSWLIIQRDAATSHKWSMSSQGVVKDNTDASDYTQVPPIPMPPVSVPDGAVTGAGQSVNNDPNGTSCTDFSLANGGSFTFIQPGTYCFHNFTVGQGATVSTSSPVTIYVSGTMSLLRGSTIGDTSDPTKLACRLTSIAPGVTLGETGAGGVTPINFYGTLYAPTQTITVNKATVYGSLMGKVVSFIQGAAVHYDEAVKQVSYASGGGGSSAGTLLSWKEP